MQVTQYIPPPTVRAFIADYLPGELFYDFIVGPLGSGKTTGLFMKIAYMAARQKRGPDGVRRSRAVVVRNTKPQLKDTTVKSFLQWFKPDVAGKWHATDLNFDLKVGDIECEIMFRALDTAEDIARVLSLEVTFAVLDEFREIPKAIVDALAGRIGRYPAAKDGGATNFGMWGASNPGTEDVWWHDYLHNLNDYALSTEQTAAVQLIELFGPRKQACQALLVEPSPTYRYFHQPPGDGDEAENLENLPEGYYANQMKGKTVAWIEQYVRARWGFSASETPVVRSFQPALHVAKAGLVYSPYYRLVIGLDPGIQGTAAVFGQEDIHGRLLVLGECFARGYGAKRFLKEMVRPYIRANFPNAQVMFAPDPAAANRQPTDEGTVVKEIKQVFGPDSCWMEGNNRLSLRLDAIEEYSTRLTDYGPALQVDAVKCVMLTRALGGGWRYQKMARSSEINRAEPDKNDYSHIGDSFGYLCRFYARQYERYKQRGMLITPAGGQHQMRRTGPTTNPHYHLG